MFSKLVAEAATPVDTFLSALTRTFGDGLTQGQGWRHFCVEEGLRNVLLLEAKCLQTEGRLIGDPLVNHPKSATAAEDAVGTGQRVGGLSQPKKRSV